MLLKRGIYGFKSEEGFVKNVVKNPHLSDAIIEY